MKIPIQLLNVRAALLDSALVLSLERIPRPRRRLGKPAFALMAALAALAVWSAFGVPGLAVGTAGARTSPGNPCSGCVRMLWGVSLGPPVPLDWNPLTKFEQMIGKNASVVPFGSPFESCGSRGCEYVSFPGSFMRKVRSHGAIPFLSWASESVPAKTEEKAFTLKTIISGRYDAYIRKFASQAAAWGHPFFLRYDWEMNGNWFPWDAKVGRNSAAQFVAAWRHVHNIFTQEGATNVSWVWCPNVDPLHLWTSLRALYPGNAYVNWTCLDGYNWGTDRGVWMTFKTLYRTTYQKIVTTVAPSKPMIIGEVSSNNAGGSQAGWIRQMFSQLPSYPKVHGFVWWNLTDQWGASPLKPKSAGALAFKQGVSRPEFAANTFCNLEGSLAVPPVEASITRTCASS